VARLASRLTYANVVASLALFVALGGGAYAAVALPKNSVGSRQIKNAAVTHADLAKNAVTGANVKDGSLLSADFKTGQLPAGPPGPKGDSGAPGLPGAAGQPGAPAASGISNSPALGPHRGRRLCRARQGRRNQDRNRRGDLVPDPSHHRAERGVRRGPELRRLGLGSDGRAGGAVHL
jgi:hypothetical protein